ncbi:MAG: TIGR03619 family F420-dependent LLM class oxidoreductase [Alphaproteobacteria bacterium]|nr:TIGR03619 family F420-dependent LLM class oxidoreductase [Alphaproteobacteria bacterium]
MQLGASFPSVEIGNDPAAIRDFAQGVEDLGFDYITTTDHVLQVDPAGRTDVFAPYTIDDAFHEPFVLYGFLAACTSRIGLATGILILPQRQAVLVAKQAAEVDVLSGGRLRLGVGVGWQELEFEALGMEWRNRGRRCEEQVAVMRALWTSRTTSFDGEFHRIGESGINPNAVQRPIPVWFGGMADAVAERVGRIGDGWIPIGTPEQLKPQRDILRAAAEQAGRDPDGIGIEAITGMQNAFRNAPPATMEQVLERVRAWRDVGATHAAFGTSMIGLGHDVDAHLKLMKEFRERAQAL